MQRLDFVLEVKTGLRVAEARSVDQVTHLSENRAEPLAEVEACGFHSCTPFSTASSSSETFTKIDPPSL